MKKILYIDLDNVLVDFQSAFEYIPNNILKLYKDNRDDIPGIFSLMRPMPGAIESFKLLYEHFDVYILSTAPWRNPSAWSDKVIWVQHHLGDLAKKRLILTHHKELNKGDYLVDDRPDRRGVDQFEGEVIHFGSTEFPDWNTVVRYLLERI
jgi:5'(3')-deoxyribonucleotidase